MSCLYITESGVVIGVMSQRLEVKYKSGRERSIPIETLESIEIFGKSQMTAQAMQKYMERLIPVSFHSHGGYYLGKLSPARNINISRQRLQFKMTENEKLGICFRIQKSAFELMINHHQYKVLLSDLEKYVDDEDSIRAYRIVGYSELTVIGEEKEYSCEEVIIM